MFQKPGSATDLVLPPSEKPQKAAKAQRPRTGDPGPAWTAEKAKQKSALEKSMWLAK